MPRTKSKTVKLQVRVQADVAAFLTAKARHAGMPVTELGGALLDYAAQAEAKEEGEALILPTVRQVVRQELSLFLERTLDFQVRTYMEAGTACRMVQATSYYAEEIAGLKGKARLERIKELEEVQWSATWAASCKHFEKLLELRTRLGYGQEGEPIEEPEPLADESATSV